MKVTHLFALTLLGLGCAPALSNAAEIFSDDFETVASDGWALWTGYPNPTVTDNQNRAVENTGSQIFNAPDGTVLPASIPGSTRSGKLWQIYWFEGQPGSPLTSATFKQWTGEDVTGLKGQFVTVNMATFTSSYDSYAGGNSSAQMFVKYFDASWGYLGGQFDTLSDNPTNTWLTNTMTFTVPTDPSLATIQIGIDNNQANWGGGSVYVDNVSVTAVPEPSGLALLAACGGVMACVARRRVAKRG